MPQNTLKEIIPLPKASLKEKARAITAEEKAFSAKHALRTAWANKHYDGKKKKRAIEKANAKEAKRKQAEHDKQRKIQVALASRFMRRLIRVTVDLKKIKLPKVCKAEQAALSKMIKTIQEIETVDGISP